MGISKSDPIIIVGASASALSVALHLSLRGYTKVSVFAKDDYIPFGDLTNVVYHSIPRNKGEIELLMAI
jgi:thioredoxin reductase